MLPSRWRVLRDSAHDAAWNMAADEALLSSACDDGCAVLRLYSWSKPAISFGRNETLRGRFDPATLAASGFDLVRRPTGGRALLHVDEVTYAVALPVDEGTGWRAAYDSINRLLCRSLERLGVAARIVGDDEGASLPPSHALCFTAPAAGEIVVDGAKLVASAVWRDRRSFLQQGSILVSGDQEPLRALGGLDAAMVGRIATLRACSAPSDFGSVADAVIAALAETCDVTVCAPDSTLQRHTELRVHHFRDPSWLWRR